MSATEDAAAVLAAHQLELRGMRVAARWVCTCGFHTKDLTPSVMYVHQAEALAEAGLLPTETEWEEYPGHPANQEYAAYRRLVRSRTTDRERTARAPHHHQEPLR